MVDILPPLLLALPSSEAECPSWQLQSSLLAAEALTDTWPTSDSSDLSPAHPVASTDGKLGILESNTAMQPAVLEQESAMLATKLPEPALPASNIEMIPQQNSSLVFIGLENNSSNALPPAPTVYQNCGTDYVFDRLQPRGKQLLLSNFQQEQSPVAAESTAFFTLGSIAAFGSKCVTACAALLQPACRCGFALRYGQSCSDSSMCSAIALLQPRCL